MVQPLNVLLIVVDTARFDDAFLTEPVTMPTLLSLARDGTRFENAFASAPWTLPSHAALFTGMYSSGHGAHGKHRALSEAHTTLAEVFRAEDYETWAASNNTWISGEFGFDRGFDEFWRGWQIIQTVDDVGSILHELGSANRVRAAMDGVLGGNPFVNAVNACYNHVYRSRGDYGGNRMTERITSWLAERDASNPFFAFLNFLEPHIRYSAPKAYVDPFLPAGASYNDAKAVRQDPRAFDVGEYDLSDRETALLRALYRGELAYVDAQIARIRNALEASGELEETILVVLGDHGENIGEHGFLGHQYNVYDTLIHVPLVITGGPFDGGTTVDDLVQLTDIAPTLLDTIGAKAPTFRTQQQGQSFHPDQNTSRGAVVAEYVGPQPPVSRLEERFGPLPSHVYDYDRSLRTIRTQREKLIRGSDGDLEYYEISSDPAEQEERSDQAPDAVARLEERLDQWVGGFGHHESHEDVAISKGTKRRLANLGYM